MPAPADLSLNLRHLVPLRLLPPRSVRERIGFDVAHTPVRIPGVEPGAMEHRDLTLGSGAPVRLHVHDGGLWRRMSRRGADGFVDVAGIDEAIALITGWRHFPPMALTPCLVNDARAVEPDRFSTVPYDTPPPERMRARLVEDLAGEAALHAERLATERLRNDGLYVYERVEAPSVICGSQPFAKVDILADPTWMPCVPYDRTDMIDRGLRERLRFGADELRQARELARERIGRLREALPEVPGGDAHLRAWFSKGGSAFLAWANELRGPDPIAPADRTALGAVVARACIDALAPAEWPDAYLVMRRVGEAVAEAHPRSMTSVQASDFLKFGTDVVAPALAERPTHDEDAADLGRLVP